MSRTTPEFDQSVAATKVDYVNLGRSGLKVSVPILGGMSLGDKKWAPWVVDGDEALSLLKEAYDRGINTWDTAGMYSNGVSEEIFGQAMKKFNIPREKLVIMSKCCIAVGEQPGVFMAPYDKSKDYINQGGLSRAAIFNNVEATLRRIGTNYLDVLFIHRFDPSTPVEETMKALHDLVESGKVRYLGASSMWATQFARLQTAAEVHGWTKFVVMQNYWNLAYREEEREMVRYCKDTGVGITPWSALFGGKLARPSGYQESVRSKMPSPHGTQVPEGEEKIIARVEELAKKKGWTMSQVSLAWLVGKGAIPITGFNKGERIEEASQLRGKELTAEEVKYLEEPYVPRIVMGHF